MDEQNGQLREKKRRVVIISGIQSGGKDHDENSKRKGETQELDLRLPRQKLRA